jgi:hypothetical protein
MLDCPQIAGRELHLSQRFDLAEREVGIVRVECDLRRRHELH